MSAAGLPDIDGRVARLSAAVRELTAAGERHRAAMACVDLGQTYENALGNLTAARAWFTRAKRLLEHEPPCIEQGWVAIAAMGCDVDDPGALLASAELALERARRFGDVNLETKALADAGLAHVQFGRTSQGMALLDEAMALACGPANDSGAAAQSVCSFFTACYHAADFARASSWTGPLTQHGLLGSRNSGAVFLSSHCDSVQATLLMELGRWGEAEVVLLRSIEAFESAMPFPAWHPAIALADLRVRQGRLGEADELLLGKDQALQALLPAARLHLARGEAALARADLVDRLEGVDDEAQLDRRARTGVGPLLDRRARAAYRQRIEALRGAAAEAMERGQLEAAEAAQDELSQLVAQLAQAFGLGGKERPSGSAAERARLNVTRAVRSAIERIGEALPEAGATLDRQVRTGQYCAYEPQNGAISWTVQS